MHHALFGCGQIEELKGKARDVAAKVARIEKELKKVEKGGREVVVGTTLARSDVLAVQKSLGHLAFFPFDPSTCLSLVQ